jgi:hypothetical protein
MRSLSCAFIWQPNVVNQYRRYIGAKGSGGRSLPQVARLVTNLMPCPFRI